MKQCVSVPKQCVGGVCDRCRMEKNEKVKQMNTQELETENSVLRSTLKQTKETLKDILAFIEAMETN